MVFLALGSNVGDRRGHLRAAVEALASCGRVERISSVYETDPVGYLEQGAFFNLVVRVRTPLEPRELLVATREIERARGRERPFRNAPRALDIDLLLFGERRVDEPGLEIPHPRMRDRLFVLVPLVELDPALRDPTTGARYADRLGQLLGDESPAAAGVVRIGSGAELLEEAGDG